MSSPILTMNRLLVRNMLQFPLFFRCAFLFLGSCVLVSVVGIPHVDAAYGTLTYRYAYHLFTLRPADYDEWKTTEETWFYRGEPVQPLNVWRTDGDHVPALPFGVERRVRIAWDREAIARVIQLRIATVLNRDPGSVVIGRADGGAVTFDGVGLPGRRVRIEEAVTLTIQALEEGIDDIILPVDILQPAITVTDPYLQDRGIAEVVTVGESDFAGSSANRIHNITVGLARFNGHIIPQGATFSFNDVMGPVNRETGYKPELVILGDKTLPEYGGGLCQVSTTAYRGVWEYGFPIVARRNHSFVVRYYSPPGTDATIYPPNTDMRFMNDGPSDLLLQTHIADGKAYFIYYGLRDTRTADLIGPYTWGNVPPPAERIEYTTSIPPGTTRKAGEAVPGVRAAWFRIVYRPGVDPVIENYYSIYEARPYYLQIGIEPGQIIPGTEPEEPDWLHLPDSE